jgi:hypothetical protein
MRFPLTVLIACAALAAQAQSQPRPIPPGSKALEEPPPMPAATTEQELALPAIQPQMTTRMEGEQEITEYRVKGKLYMMRVKPKNGPAYTLMDHKGDGTFMKQDHTLTPNTAVPQWVLLEF